MAAPGAKEELQFRINKIKQWKTQFHHLLNSRHTLLKISKNLTEITASRLHTCDKVALGRRRRWLLVLVLLVVVLLMLMLLIFLLILVMRPLLLLVPRVRLLVLTHVPEAAVRAHARVPRPHETGNAETVRNTRRELNSKTRDGTRTSDLRTAHSLVRRTS